MDWRQAADQFGITVEDLKENLPLEWVINVGAGVPLEEQGEGRARGICPFHDDEDPSLDVYGYGTRWGCFPCGQGGDLFDFIGSFWELDTFAARFEKAVNLYRAFRDEDAEWTGVVHTAEPTEPVTTAMIQAEVGEAQNIFAAGTRYPLAQLLENKNLDIDPVWLAETWGVGVTHDFEILAPFYDHEGELVSYKTRFPSRGGWYARKGRTLTALYGEWQLRDEKNVWICEGETDTWLASYLLRGRGVALGLPRGAGSHVDPEWVELLRGRRVTLVFDADAAGRRAAVKWHNALHGAADEIHISFPDSDLCETSDPVFTLDNGINVIPNSGFIQRRADGLSYQQVGRNGPGEDINNWILDPMKYIAYVGLDGAQMATGYEGHFTDDKKRRVLITSEDLKSGATAVDWSNANRRVWFASGSKWTQSVLSMLNETAPFLPRVEAVSLVGLHGLDRNQPVFVLPEDVGTTIGSELAKEKWIHYPKGTSVDFGANYELKAESMSAEQLQQWALPLITNMLNLNDRDVITPIIAWLAASPLRSTVVEFPSLAVLGGSGSGKTSLLQQILSAFFGIKDEQNLSSQSTPYGLTAWALGTNALPVWYDEYRAQARQANLDAVDQLLRDAWSGSTSSRGGYGEDKTQIRTTKVTAPIIVSGESEFEERSHIDRVIMVKLPDKNSGHMNEGAFEAFSDGIHQPGRLGRLYLEWLAYQLELGAIIPPKRALDRQSQGNNILIWGWELFTRFCQDVLRVTGIGELDLAVAEESRSDADEHVILTALADALESDVRDDSYIPVVWQVSPHDGANNSVIAVRPHQFHQWASRHGYQLPGSASATRSWLKKRFTVVKNTGRVQYNDPVKGVQRIRAVQLVGVVEAIEEDING